MRYNYVMWLGFIVYLFDHWEIYLFLSYYNVRTKLERTKLENNTIKITHFYNVLVLSRKCLMGQRYTFQQIKQTKVVVDR